MGPQPPPKDAWALEAGLPLASQEKVPLATTESTYLEDLHRRRMSSPRRLLLGLSACLLLWLGMTAAAPARQNVCPHGHDGHGQPGDATRVRLAGEEGRNFSPQPESPFACLLNAVSSEALHDVLHRYFPNRFKDGIYESDHSAMEAVHREDPPLAISLVHIAKRQTGGSNTTVTTTPTTTTTSPPPPPPPRSTSTTPTTPLPPPTTSSPGTTSTPAPPPSSTTTTRPLTSSPDSDTTSPTPTRAGSTSPRSQRPQTTTYTSTFSNGDVVVVTATTFVNADPVETTGTRPGGSLQTNAAAPRARNIGAEAFAGVILGGLLLV